MTTDLKTTVEDRAKWRSLIGKSLVYPAPSLLHDIDIRGGGTIEGY